MSHNNNRKISRFDRIQITADGSSLVSGNGATSVYGIVQTFMNQTMGFLGRRFPNAVLNNIGIGGQTWRQMDGLDGGSSTDVDSSFIPASVNVLVALKTSNSIVIGSRTPAQAAADAQSYVQNRLRLNPGWLIVMVGTIPREGGLPTATYTTVAAGNVALLQTDLLISQHCRAWGAKSFVPLRNIPGGPQVPGSFMNYPDWSVGSFNNDIQMWSTTLGETTTTRTHFGNAGYVVMGKLVAQAVTRVLSK